MVMLLKPELDLALDLARRGGALSLQMQNDLTVSHKPHGLGPVSDADLAIDHLICSEIAARFPEDLIISEESFAGLNVREAKRVWFIDPIDGTSSYIVGREDFVVMIGLAINGVAVMGVVYQPALDIMWYGINTEQLRFCHKTQHDITTPISVPDEQDKNALINLKLMVSRTSKSKKQGALIEHLAPATLLHYSSFGLKAMMVMTGEADFYVCWSKQLSFWDTCGPQAIMTAANGVLSFIDGRPLTYVGSITHGGAIMAARFKPDLGLLALLKQIDEHPPQGPQT